MEAIGLAWVTTKEKKTAQTIIQVLYVFGQTAKK